MDKSKKIKITQEDSQKSSVSNSDRTAIGVTWVQSSTNNNHIYFNDEWNGEYEDSNARRLGGRGSGMG